MKKSILLVACTLLMAFATQAQTADKPAVNPNASEMTFDALEFDFGTIKQGEEVNHEFEFVNSGKEDLIITNASGSCGCTVPEHPKDAIKRGGKGVIKVKFNSAGKMGMQDKTVTIQSNAKNNPVILHLKGKVEPPAPVANPAATPGK
jgi:hypothetical protein